MWLRAVDRLPVLLRDADHRDSVKNRWCLTPFTVLLLATGCGHPPAKIIHIANYHFVARDDFAADLRDQSADITDAEIDQQYAEFLDDVETVQNEQIAILRGLIREHGIKAVFMEGVTDENVAKFRATAKELPELDLPELHRQMKETEDFAEQALLLVTIDEHRAKLLELGAVGHLMRTGELDDVLPLDDAYLMKAANPVKNGFRFDGEANEKRERAMARRLTDGGPVAVVILGGGHDLSKDLRDYRFEVIVPEAYRAVVAK